MPVHPTGFSGQAVVPCSHCNANDQGPEAGICHRNPFSGNVITVTACNRCIEAAEGHAGIVGSVVRMAVMALSGQAVQVPCSFCHGKGYLKA